MTVQDISWASVVRNSVVVAVAVAKLAAVMEAIVGGCGRGCDGGGRNMGSGASGSNRQ